MSFTKSDNSEYVKSKVTSILCSQEALLAIEYNLTRNMTHTLPIDEHVGHPSGHTPPRTSETEMYGQCYVIDGPLIARNTRKA